MDYPKHTPLAAAALALAAGGYAAVRPQPAPLAPPQMVAVHSGQQLGRNEPRKSCDAACAHLNVLGCFEGRNIFCASDLVIGAPPMSPAKLASCDAIAQAIDVADAVRMGVRCE